MNGNSNNSNGITLKFIQNLHDQGYLQVDFKLFGVPQNDKELEIFLIKYQKIRNMLQEVKPQ